MSLALLTMENFENRRPFSVGSSRLRGTALQKYWPELETFENGHRYDVVIYQKAYYLTHMETTKAIKIFDLCDPDWLDGRPVAEMLGLVDAVVTSTETLRDTIQAMVPNKPVLCIPDRLDLADYPRQKMKRHSGRGERLVWFGYSDNNDCLEELTAGSPSLLEQWKVQLTAISNADFNGAGKERVINLHYDQATINDQLRRHDILVLPFAYRPENAYRWKFKSNNKTLVGWACGLPVLDYRNRNLVEDLQRFLENADARQAEATEKRKELEAHWDVRQSVKEWQDFLRKEFKVGETAR